MEDISIRIMKEEDFDEVHHLWEGIRGLGLRSIDDSREGVVRFLRRNPTTSVVAEAGGRTDEEAAFTMSAWIRHTGCAASGGPWRWRP